MKIKRFKRVVGVILFYEVAGFDRLTTLRTDGAHSSSS